jgi:hypothetical protein
LVSQGGGWACGKAEAPERCGKGLPSDHGSNRGRVDAGRGPSRLPSKLGASRVNKPLPLQGPGAISGESHLAQPEWSDYSYPPTPRGNLDEYQRKGLSKKAICKLLKMKGRFAHGQRRDALGSDRRAGQATHTPPTPWVKSHRYHSKRVAKRVWWKLLKRKG